MHTHRLSTILPLAACLGLFSISCKKKTEEVIKEIEKEVIVKDTTKPALRPSFDYNRLAAKTPYDSLFLDASGAKTVDLTEGNTLRTMLADINAYAGRASGANNDNLDSVRFINMFLNSGFPFTTTPSLNNSSLNIRSITGTTSSNPVAVHTFFRKCFSAIDVASDSVLTTASAGKAGKIANAGTGKYLLDANGVEQGQLIQKGFIGAVQLDYITNVLLSDAKMNAENHYLVPGKNYTELEHNWDVAFGLFTLNKVYGITATNTNNGGEGFIGGYSREYGNSDYDNDYLKLHPAFLKGRAAVVNNDLVEAKAQAKIIKTIFEKVVARAAVGYLKKWKDGVSGVNPDRGAAMHAMGEGAGFIYSLRFCTLNGADNAFSDDILNSVIYSNVNGLWGLTEAKANLAIDKIKTKFGLL